MEFSPFNQSPDVVPQQKEIVTKDEADIFFSKGSFSGFSSDLAKMVQESHAISERKEELVSKLSLLYVELENGFTLDDLEAQYTSIVGVPTNQSEKEILGYFLYSIRTLYKKFRMEHPKEEGK